MIVYDFSITNHYCDSVSRNLLPKINITLILILYSSVLFLLFSNSKMVSLINKLIFLAIVIGSLRALSLYEDPLITECKKKARSTCDGEQSLQAEVNDESIKPYTLIKPTNGYCLYRKTQECIDQHPPKMPPVLPGAKCAITRLQYPCTFVGVEEKFTVWLPYYHCTYDTPKYFPTPV